MTEWSVGDSKMIMLGCNVQHFRRQIGFVISAARAPLCTDKVGMVEASVCFRLSKQLRTQQAVVVAVYFLCAERVPGTQIRKAANIGEIAPNACTARHGETTRVADR